MVRDENLYEAVEAFHGSEMEGCETCHTSGVDEGLVLQQGVADLEEGERDEGRCLPEGGEIRGEGENRR